jgi:hypothetical protein
VMRTGVDGHGRSESQVGRERAMSETRIMPKFLELITDDEAALLAKRETITRSRKHKLLSTPSGARTSTVCTRPDGHFLALGGTGRFT